MTAHFQLLQLSVLQFTTKQQHFIFLLHVGFLFPSFFLLSLRLPISIHLLQQVDHFTLTSCVGQRCGSFYFVCFPYISHPRQFERFSYNKKTTTKYRYLVAVDTVTNQVIFVYGPCAGSTAEIEMVRSSDLLNLLPQGARIIADGGFRGEEQIVTPFRQYARKGLAQPVYSSGKLAHRGCFQQAEEFCHSPQSISPQSFSAPSCVFDCCTYLQHWRCVSSAITLIVSVIFVSWTHKTSPSC